MPIHSGLGAKSFGSYSSGSATLARGDIIVAGTDGVMDFDWVKKNYSPVNEMWIIGKIRSRKSTLHTCLEEMLTHLNSKGPQVINDNITLGAICA